MKSYGFLALTVFLLVGFAHNVNAAPKSSKGGGVVLAPAIFYNTSLFDRASGPATKSDGTEMALNGRLGFRFKFPLYIGGVYLMDNITVKAASGPDSTDNMSAYGASVGFMNQGFFLIAHYYLSATRETKTTTTNTYKEGTGFGGEIGYAFAISNHVAIAPEIHYRNIEYKKAKLGSAAEGNNTTKTSDMQPYFGVHITF